MDVSVVIPVWNGKKFLQENLPVVLKLGAGEIIIVDDASPDGAADWVEKNYPNINLIRQKNNLRFPKTVNRGFAESGGQLVLLLNQDAKPDKNLISAILPYFEDEKFFAVTFNDGVNSWAAANFENGFVKFGNGRKTETAHPSFWASGGASVWRKSIWDELGGFNEIYTPGYYEDLDIGWRGWKAGYKIWWVPGAKVEHNNPESAFKMAFGAKKLTKIQERNFLLAHWVNLDNEQLWSHVMAVVGRIINNPGYIVPVVQAIAQMMKFGLKRQKSKLKNSEFFGEFRSVEAH